VSLGSGLAFLAVGLGAFGTHSLRGKVSDPNLQVWQTAVQYHMVHAVAIVLVGILATNSTAKGVRMAGWLFTAGIAIFGGTLYTLTLTNLRWLGAITPIGGLCFLAGWAALCLGAAQSPDGGSR